MKVLKTFDYTTDGIHNKTALKGTDAPEGLDEITFQSLVAEGYIGDEGDRATKSMGRRDVENKDMGSQQAPENKDPAGVAGDQSDDSGDHEDEDGEGEDDDDSNEIDIPEGFEELDADDMKALAKSLTNQDYRTKTAAKKAIAEIVDQRQAG